MEDISDVTSSWSLLSWLASGAIVFGGVLPYIPQYHEIKRTSSAEGFSTWVCLVLLVANILRIFFWFGKLFELPLLLQSVVMIATMLTMLHLCCSIQSVNKVSTKRHFFTDFDRQYFWKWSRFEDYLHFCLVFTVFCTLISYIFMDAYIFVEGIGFLSVLIEAMLGIPQLLKNYHNRSTQGMRFWYHLQRGKPYPTESDQGQIPAAHYCMKMVLLWTAGDCFKTGYFIINHTPAQFWFCGLLQIAIDIAILFQVCFYKQRLRSQPR